MTSTPTPIPAATATPTLDRPPILRFLMLFAGLLVLATGLAAFSFAAEPPQGANASAGAPAPR
jgi:hypothetical protein